MEEIKRYLFRAAIDPEKKDTLARAAEADAAGIRKALLAAEGALLPEAEPEEQLKTCRRMGSFSVLINGLISARVTVWDSGCLIIRPTASDASLNAPFTYMIGEKAAGEILKTIEDSGSVNQSETVTWVTVPAKKLSGKKPLTGLRTIRGPSF